MTNDKYLIAKNDGKVLCYRDINVDYFGYYKFCDMEAPEIPIEYSSKEEAQRIIDGSPEFAVNKYRKECRVIKVIKQPRYRIISIS
jgi:hypothetical protein